MHLGMTIQFSTFFRFSMNLLCWKFLRGKNTTSFSCLRQVKNISSWLSSVLTWHRAIREGCCRKIWGWLLVGTEPIVINTVVYGAPINGRKSIRFTGDISPRYKWSYGPLFITATWRIIPVSKWLGSPPFISYKKAIWKGIARSLGDLRTMGINHLHCIHWGDPPSKWPKTNGFHWGEFKTLNKWSYFTLLGCPRKLVKG